jgi:SAM-dependent methyltransferase
VRDFSSPLSAVVRLVVARRFAQLKYALRRHRPAGLIRLAAHNACYHIRAIAQRQRRALRADPFDREHGTDTAGQRNIASLDVIDSPAAPYAVHYEPSSAQLVRRELAKLSIDAARFTFIDFGSGKGRVLLVAAAFPFKAIIGIEFSRELHDIALRNIARLPPDLARGARVRSINGEAGAFDLPDSDVVCYFNNPFGPPIITQVLQRLIAHHRDRGYRVIVIYVVPRHRDLFEKCGLFEILDATRDTVILTTPAEAGAPLRG